MNQEDGLTLVSTLRKHGPGWARALDHHVQNTNRSDLTHPCRDMGGEGVTYHWFHICGKSGQPNGCAALLTAALECAEPLGETS